MQHRKNYLAWLVADTAADLGASLRAFAIPVLVLVTGGTAIQASSLSSIAAFVIALLTIIGGVIVDRYDRKKLLLISTALGTCIFTIFSLWAALIGFSYMMLLILAVVTGVRSGILGSVSNVLLRDVVDKKELARAISINQGRDATVQIIASPLSGFLIGIKAIIPLIVEAIINAVAFCAAWFIHPLSATTAPAEKALAEDDSAEKTLVEGALTEQMIAQDESVEKLVVQDTSINNIHTETAAHIETAAHTTETMQDQAAVSSSHQTDVMPDAAKLETTVDTVKTSADSEVEDFAADRADEEPNQKIGPIGKLKNLFVEAASAIPFLVRSPITSRVTIASVTFFPLLNALLLLLIFHTIETGHSAISAGMVNTGVAVGVLVGAAISTMIVEKISTGKITILAFVTPLIFALAALLSPILWLRILFIAPMLLILPAGNAAFGGFGMLLVPQKMLGRYVAVLRLGELIFSPLAILFVGFGLTYLGEILTGGILLVGMALVVLVVIHPQIIKIPTPEKWESYLKEINIHS